jgi:excisionase family DNA binding protein
MSNPVLGSREAATYLNLSLRTLEDWRRTGTGPAFAKLGSRVVYRVADLDAWVAARLVASTSEARA